jgi:hypothetical protein
MRFYTNTSEHQFYCGVDLHARTMYLCIAGEPAALTGRPGGTDELLGRRRLASATVPALARGAWGA